MLEDINAFCAIAQLKSFAKAARQLGISTPVITRRLARLEQSLDVRLLHRTTREVSLTEAGVIFYEEVRDILLALESSKKNIKNLSKEITGTLKVGMPVSLSQLYVTPALKSFLQQYPNLNIQIINGNHLLNLLSNGFDLVIHCSELPDSNFYYKKLGSWKKIICAAPTYLKKHGTPKLPEDLQAHNCLDHYDNADHAWTFKTKGVHQEILVNGNVRVNSSLHLKNLAVAGLGVAYLPSFSVHDELKSGKLISILEQFQPPELNAYVVYPSNKYMSKKTQVFIEFLTEVLRPVFNYID